MNIEKWQKAVINIECAGKSEFISNYTERASEVIDRWRKGAVSINSLLEEYNRIMKSRKCDGTAIFFSHNDKSYLITAKHIVYDDIIQNNETDFIYDAIFRIPSFNDYMNGLVTKPLQLHALDAAHLPVPFFFHPQLDLAIILLDERNKEFRDELIRLGHEPITIEDIDQGDIAEGTDIFTIGFPGTNALVMQIELTQTQKPWDAGNFSLPVASFGKVAMNNAYLGFFWTDLSLYFGNGGGPVIANNKLVGVVSGQASGSAELASSQFLTMVPFNGIIKSKYILELIQPKDD